tara:strand:- start:181 stop:549 length:369 start_codon:yes stop_codon:yes gene_type:complete
MKKYLNISEVSKIVGLKEHTIRYWDSIDPKTNKLRIEGISTKSKGGTRYFNKENLNNLKKLKKIIYFNGDHNTSIKLAKQILYSNKNEANLEKLENSTNINDVSQKLQKMDQILKKMRILLK